MNTAIYLRVSTSDQRVDSQEQELRDYCQRRGWHDPNIYSDKLSGARASRPGLDKLLTAVRGGKVQRVVVFKLDRLGRSLTHLALILEELQRHVVPLVVTSQGIDTSADNPVGRLQLNVLMAVAEFERELIRERVRAGVTAARARGVKFGRPKTHQHGADAVLALKATGIGVRAISRRLGIPVSSVSLVCRRAASHNETAASSAHQ